MGRAAAAEKLKVTKMTKILKLNTFICLLLFGFMEIGHTANLPSTQILVFLRQDAVLANFSKQLPHGLSILAKDGNLLILRSALPVQEDELASIRKMPMVSSANLDNVQRPLFGGKKKSPSESECTSNPLGDDNAQNVSSFLQAITGSTKCSVSGVCPNSGIEKLWAQRRMDADLMLAYIQDKNLRTSDAYSPVTVLDSGFDSNQTKNMVNAAALKVEPGVFGIASKAGDPNSALDGNSLVGNPGNDVVGHGTMVASVIGGKDGLGVAPHAALSVYQITADDSGTTSTAFIAYAIHRACRKMKTTDPASTPIINVSWGSREDEMGKRDEADEKGLIDYLSQQGCIVIKAAGNDSFRSNDNAVNGSELDAPYTRVAASNSFGGSTSFSSSGEISAPGEDVMVLESSEAKDKASDDKRCGDDSQRFVNGTSFAAPLTAGIASELVGVLRSGPKFDALTPAKRIALVNRILAASQVGGSVNGLKAVLIATRWAQLQSSDILPQAQLTGLLDNPQDPACASMPASVCEKEDTCGALRTCFNQKRFRAAVCSKTSPNELLDLVQTAENNSALESATQYYGDFLKLNPSTASLRNANLQLTNAYLSRWTQVPGEKASVPNLDDLNNPETGNSLAVSSGIKSGFAQDVLEPLLANETNPKSESAQKGLYLLDSYLESPGLLDYLQRGKGRGSEDVLATAGRLLVRERNLFGKKVFDAHLNTVIDKHLSELDPDYPSAGGDRIITVLRLLEEMRQHPEFSDEVPYIEAKEQRIWELLDKYEFPSNRENASHVIAGLGETHANRPYLETLIKAHSSELKSKINSGSAPDLSGVKAVYILEHVGDFVSDPELQLELASKINASLAKRKNNPYELEAKAANAAMVNSYLATASADKRVAIIDQISDPDTLYEVFTKFESSFGGTKSAAQDADLSRIRRRSATALFDRFRSVPQPDTFNSLDVMHAVNLLTFDEVKEQPMLFEKWLHEAIGSLKADPIHSLPILKSILANGYALSQIPDSSPVFQEMGNLQSVSTDPALLKLLKSWQTLRANKSYGY